MAATIRLGRHEVTLSFNRSFCFLYDNEAGMTVVQCGWLIAEYEYLAADRSNGLPQWMGDLS